jgi:ribosome modulation factor
MMKNRLRSLAFLAAFGVAPTLVCPVVLHAQQVNEDQRAYQTGYQNGVNAARRNAPMNMNTDDWHGDRLNAYQKGYHEGYTSVSGRGEPNGHYENHYANDPEQQRAFQTGYQNGVNAAERHKPMNPSTGDWHGDRLEAYQHGYEQGYHSVR